MQTYDVVIVGGGHNGLVCGAYLARAGYKVCVLERRETLGGASATEEVWPGYRVNTAAHMLGLLQPRIIRDLELQAFGYEVLKPPPTIHVVDGAGAVPVWGDRARMAAEIARFAPQDAGAFTAYSAHLAALGVHFRRLLWEIPFTPSDLSLRGLMRKAAFAVRNRGMIRHLQAVTDLMAMSAHDYLGRWFSSAEMMTIMGYYPAAGSGQSTTIYTPGTAFFLLRGNILEPDPTTGGTGLVRGGMGMVPQAIAASAARFGLETRTAATVERILVRNGKATGVALASGEELQARAVIANAAVQTVFGTLVDPAEVPADYHAAATALRCATTAFKVHLGLRGLPTPAPDCAHPDVPTPAQFTAAPSIAYLDRAYADMLAGRVSDAPYMTIQIPTVVDPSLAPTGHHMMSIYGGHVPRSSDGIDQEALRATVLDRAIRTAERYYPDLAGLVEHTQVLLPSDYERVIGLPGGSPHHLDLTPDQLFFRRPVYGFADYTTPVTGLFLCGASTHPGGGVTGVPGHNAARVVGTTLRRR